ncbi:GmrSD restriction endonuclease domain-containing protein [Kosakonia oryzendophytica]|uniref:GmrSD restriction endonuclease domain-containing protein n=1 Tax=Kosakonia oryzendophytica TaxID=1005665 RepID=UPI003D347716
MESSAITKKKIDSGNQRLASLLDDVTRGNIKIPAFQREFVWSDEQILGLIDSIYSGYPVGSLLLWSTKIPLKFERNVGGFYLPEVKEDYPVNYVLDGQQRLTTLFGVFNADRKTENKDLAVRFNIHYVPALDAFYNYQTLPADTASIPLSNILDTAKLLPELRRFSPNEQDRIANLVDKFKDYEFPIVTIKERSNQEVCRIFQRINSSGTSLSTIELLTAWTWSEDFNLRSEMDSLKEYLSSVGYEQIDEVLLMRCLTAIINKKIDSDTLIDVDPEILLSAMQDLKGGVNNAVDFLAKDLKIKNSIFLPFPIMLVPITYFFAKVARPTGFQYSSIKRWFWCCAFSQRYKAGTNTYVMEDILSMDGIINSPDAYVQPMPKIETGFFKKTWRINSSAAKASICLLSQLGPRSFITGKTVDLETALAAYNARQFHHIYPKAYLSKQGFAFHESNIIANIAFLTAQDNNAISDNDPKVYFPKIHEAERDLIFDAALINQVLRKGDKSYGEFIDIREADLIELATKAMTGKI